MPSSPINVFIQKLQVHLVPDGHGLTDSELLARFLRSRDEQALAALVRRHAKMVWGVCSRLLRNHHDAEDAFQATFFVLVRKANDVPKAAIANWLYGVARQTAIRVRATAIKQRQRETQVVDMPEPIVAELPNDELHAVLDEEFSRLPAHYRSVILLCDLEGLTRRETARQLGIPEGSVASRLARARAMLSRRFAQRGVALSTGSLAAVMLAASESQSAPLALVTSTITAAKRLAAGQAADFISAKVALLTNGAIKSMFIGKLKSVVMVVLVISLGLGAAGVDLLNGPTARARQPDEVNHEHFFTVAPVPKRNITTIKPYAHFLFDGNANNQGSGEAKFRLNNTKFENNALALNGIYDEPGNRQNAYKAVLQTPQIKYDRFTVALRFKAEEFDEMKSHFFSGGVGTGRWFGLSRSEKGHLAIMVNAGEFKKEIEGTTLEKGKWTVVACSVDVPAQRVILALNSKRVATIDFTKDNPLKMNRDETRQNLWTFTDYSTPAVFHGLVDELRIYDRALNESELEGIPLNSDEPTTASKDKRPSPLAIEKHLSTPGIIDSPGWLRLPPTLSHD